MKCSARRKCQHCSEFYLSDRRNLHHQRYCAKSACRKQSKAESQRRWLEKPDIKTTSAGRKTASVSKNGVRAIPGTGAKRSLRPKNRYKISARLNRLKMKEL